MGIKNINEIIKQKCSNAFGDIPLTDLVNKNIAIDTAIWLYANMSVAQREIVRKMPDIFEEIDRLELLQSCIFSALKFHTHFLDNEIHPIWIQDGKTPKEKKETRAKRKEGREKRKESIDELRNRLLEEDILLRSSKDIEELRKMLMHDINIFPEEYNSFYNALNAFGIPVIIAPAEAEAYACSLNQKGIVFGIWTTDTDCYALAGINMITCFNGKNERGIDMLSIVNIPQIRRSLSFDEDEMRDFSIMCGTDFNLNIPNVGVVRAHTAIEEHRSIENYSQTKNKDITVLNHKRVRQILTVPHCDLNINSQCFKHNIELFNELAKDLSIQYGLSGFYEKMKLFYKDEFTVTIYDIKKNPLKKITKIIIDGISIDEKKKPKIIIDDIVMNGKREIEFNSNFTSLKDIIENLE